MEETETVQAGGSGFVLTPGTLVAGRHFAGHEAYFLDEAVNVQFDHPNFVENPTDNGDGHVRISWEVEEIDEEFEFTGEIEEITIGPGVYHLQVWGAQGRRNDKLCARTTEDFLKGLLF